MSVGSIPQYYFDLPEHFSSNDVENSPVSVSFTETSVVGNTTPSVTSTISAEPMCSRVVETMIAPSQGSKASETNSTLFCEEFHSISTHSSDLARLEQEEFDESISDVYHTKEEMSKSWDFYQEQAGLEVSTIAQIMDNISQTKGISLDVSMMYQIEGFVALFFALKDVHYRRQGVAIFTLYLQRFYKKSIVETCIDFLNHDEMSEQGGTESESSWVDLLKSAHTNWTLVLANDGFSHLSKVLSLAVTLGLCESSKINFTIAGMKMFSVAAQQKHASAVDLADAVFSTVTYFVEGGSECFKQRSFKPLLYGDLDTHRIEKMVTECERFSEFAKTGDLESRTGLTNNDFESRLDFAIEHVSLLSKTTKNTLSKKLLLDKLDKLRKIQTYFMQTRVKGGLREAPYGMGFFGKSGVGKSTVSQILMVVVLLHNGYDASDDKLITLNESDKFMSNFRSYINGIFIDDIGNTKSDFVEKAPTAKLLEIINNVRAYANMAEADMKGKVSIEPKVCNTTRNVRNMGAEKYSEEPVSIVRRERLVATTTVRPQFATDGMLDSDKVTKYFGDSTPLIPDLWLFDVHRAIPIPSTVNGGTDVIGWKLLEFEGSPMKQISIITLIRYACQNSHIYFDNQSRLVANNQNLAGKLEFCKDCRLPHVACTCADGPVEGFEVVPEAEQISDSSDESSVEEQAGALLAPILYKVYTNYSRIGTNFFNKSIDSLETFTCSQVVTRLAQLEDSPYTSWTNWIPTQYIDNELLQNFMLASSADELAISIKRIYVSSALMSLFITYLALCWSFIFMVLLCFPIYLSHTAIECEKRRLLARIKDENGSMPDIMKEYRDGYIRYITGACIGISFLYLMVNTVKLIRLIPGEQGNLMPTKMTEIDDRDQEKVIEEAIAKEHGWETIKPVPIPSSPKCKTMTHQQATDTVYNNTTLMQFTFNDRLYGCDAFFVKSNVALIPQHIWKSNELHCTFHRSDSGKVGSSFDAKLSRTFSNDIPGTDLCLVYIPNGGSWKDLSWMLPTGYCKNVLATLVYKYIDVNGVCTRRQSKLYTDAKVVSNGKKEYIGASYDLEFNTFVGLCMAPVVADSKSPVIVGFHLGGVTNKVHGICGSLTLTQFEHAYDALREVSGVVLCASSGTMQTEVYGVQFFESDKIHPKSPLHKLDTSSTCEVYGSCKGRATYYSSVEDTVIAPHIKEVCGRDVLHGRPKFHLGKSWSESLKYSSKPSVGIEGNLIEYAVDDFTDHMFNKFKTIPELKNTVYPLNKMENLCGIDGRRFIDKISLSTAIGYPLSGTKEKYVELLDPEQHPDFACPAELDSQFWDEANRMEEEYRNGRRCHVAFKACLKDEPTPINKDKVRVFQAAPISMQLLIRKYYLPICRLLSLFPLDAECAVGINTKGPEFDALVRHMKKHGDDRIFAGDYSKYDLRMPAQIMFASFDILIKIAKFYDYDSDSITIMEGIATDICYPVMAYNGDLISLIGSNPSGQNLTVYINNLGNSILQRCGFKHIYPKDTPPFRDAASMADYGDDVKGSIKEGFDEFNHISYAEFLKERDIIFTMPDKTSTPTKYMNDADADFLKLKNRYNERLGLWQGTLDEESIWKSLTSVLKSSAITPKEQAMQNIDGALREWWFYGPEMYERRRSEMTDVARLAGIAPGCAMLDQTYLDCEAKYLLRYNLELVPEVQP